MRSALGRLPSPPPEGADVTTAHLAEDFDAEKIKAACERRGMRAVALRGNVADLPSGWQWEGSHIIMHRPAFNSLTAEGTSASGPEADIRLCWTVASLIYKLTSRPWENWRKLQASPARSKT